MGASGERKRGGDLAVGTHQLFCLLEGPLRLADGGLARLAGELWYLVQLLCQVGFHEPELGGVALKKLRAGVGVERVGHGEIAGRVGWIC